MIIDSHCHLSYKNNVSNIDKIIKRAKNVGVNKFLNIATKSNEFETLKDISNKYNDVFFTLGIHPHEASETSYEIIDKIRKSSVNKKFLGIGETGLDFYYSHTDKNKQIESLEMHIELAQEIELPLIIHMRESEDKLIEVFSKKIKDKEFMGVIHCFTGSLNFALNVLDFGFYISASGIVTFNKSNELRNTFKKIPLNKLLVETDSPYLAPIPKRGKQNEPSFIIHTVKKLTEIYGVNYNELCNITSSNFNNLFNRVGK